MYFHTVCCVCTCIDVDLDVVSKELAAHKEMVSVLRGQLAEKENELQVQYKYTYTL